MGSPLGPTLANIFLSYHEKIWLEKCPLQFKPMYYRRYVDDIFVMFEKEDHIKKFLRCMNSRHQNINFTTEKELNNKLSFLDITIKRAIDKITTSLFKKSTLNGVYMNFNSFLPTQYKKGLLQTLLHRAFNICSDYATIHEEIKDLKIVLQKNSFPLFIIDNGIYHFLDQLFSKRTKPIIESSKKEVSICLDFLGKILLQIKKQLKEIFRTCRKDIKLNVIFRSSNRIRNALRFKDQLPKDCYIQIHVRHLQ